MTTLQTNSARNITSADLVIQRAQSGGSSAGSAPAFDGVLEAFTDPEPDIEQIEDSESIDDAEGVDSASDEDSQSNGEEGEGEIKGAVSGTDDQVDLQSTVAGHNADQQPSLIASLNVRSAGDLGLLLTNAAQIDLADLANAQLEGQQQHKATIKQTAAVPSAVENPSSEQPRAIGQRPISDGKPRQSFNQSLGQSQTHESANVISDPAFKNATATQPQQSAESIASPQISAVSTVVQTAQAAQVVVSDAVARSGQSNRTQSQSSLTGVDVTRSISAADSSSKSNTGQSGLDLGDRSQRSESLSQKSVNDRPLMRREVMAQVQRGLASIMNTKGGTMKMRLSPDHLGEIKIELSTKDGEVQVKIDAANDDARSMLKEGLEGLRHSMESRGVRIDELRVNDPQQSAFDQMFNAADDNQTQSDRHQQDQDPDQGSSGGSSDSEHSSDESIDNDTPRGIWTELGLDAIA
jgi:flagellar hook-length control protein FliK